MTGRPGPCRTQPPCPVGLVPFHWDPMTAPKSSQRACGAPDASSLQAWSPPIPFDFEQAEQAAENRIFKISPCGATGFGPRGPQKRLEALGKVCSGRGPRLCIKFLARRAKNFWTIFLRSDSQAEFGQPTILKDEVNEGIHSGFWTIFLATSWTLTF